MHTKKMVAVVFAAVLVVTAVGCGSSKKSDNVSASDAGQTEKQSDGGNATTTSTKKSTSGTGSGSGSSGGVASSSASCIEAASAYATLFLASAGFTSGASQEEIDQFEQNAADLKAKIPSELKDDFETVSAAYKDYAELLRGFNASDAFNPATMEKQQQATDKISTPEVTAAQGRIDAYFSANCGS